MEFREVREEVFTKLIKLPKLTNLPKLTPPPINAGIVWGYSFPLLSDTAEPALCQNSQKLYQQIY